MNKREASIPANTSCYEVGESLVALPGGPPNRACQSFSRGYVDPHPSALTGCLAGRENQPRNRYPSSHVHSWYLHRKSFRTFQYQMTPLAISGLLKSHQGVYRPLTVSRLSCGSRCDECRCLFAGYTREQPCQRFDNTFLDDFKIKSSEKVFVPTGTPATIATCSRPMTSCDRQRAGFSTDWNSFGGNTSSICRTRCARLRETLFKAACKCQSSQLDLQAIPLEVTSTYDGTHPLAASNFSRFFPADHRGGERIGSEVSPWTALDFSACAFVRPTP